jgi:aldehyde:ferredoxin oxidoreductase
MEKKILRVNLTDKSYKIETLPDKVFRQYIGGRGLGTYLLNKTVKPGIDPLGPANHLIFTAGPASGTGMFYANKIAVTTKSPQTNIYLYAVSSGLFAHQLRKAGLWALDIRGISDSPVYMEIRNDGMTIHDATKIWGMESGKAQEVMVGGLPKTKAATIAIGPAGEKMLSYAAIMADGPTYRAFGRGGCGAVMGSKKLKGIIASGDTIIEPVNKKAFIEVREAILANAKQNRDFLTRQKKYGTGGETHNFSTIDLLPTRNWYGGQFEGSEKISPDTNEAEWPRESIPCTLYCPAPCSHHIEIKKGTYKGAHADGPEYETIYAFGSNLGIDKFDAIVKAAQICDEQGLDTMSTGVSIGFAMECFEKGLISKKDTDGVELRFGDEKAMFAILDKILKQEGIGKLLSQGVKAASALIPGSEAFAMHAKGMEFGGYECRAAYGQALQFAVSARGGCHHTYGRPAVFETISGTGKKVEGKGQLVKNAGINRILCDSVGVCAFTRDVIIPNSLFPKILNALFGEPWTIKDVNDAAIRSWCQERLFNMKEGLTRKDDTLPDRLLKEPKPEGPSKGSTVPLDKLLDDFYTAMGWDITKGTPTDKLLNELEIEI